MKMNICLLYGGKSAEHDVSLQTAMAVCQALDMNKFAVYPIYITKDGKWMKGPELKEPVTDVKELVFQNEEMVPHALNAALAPDQQQKYDVVFPLLHGPNGEDGTVQGMLELLNIPYVGNGVLASSAAMDKVIMKNIFAQAGLDQVKYTWFVRPTWEAAPEKAYEQVEAELGYPCFVKPANLGSSVGISKCENREQLAAAFTEAFQYDRRVIIEEGVVAREIEVGVLGNDFPECSVAGEIVPDKAFYDYEAKYKDGNTSLVIPAEISTEINAKMKDMAIKAYKALDCAGLVRADFFVTNEDRIIINEVNTMPGFTPFSMFPLLWKHTGVDYPALIEKMIELGIERHQEKQRIIHTF
ncbi:D-alanine--D-alanine ligase [Bacillus sp. FJAT-50079]|uniref:D-alanine--D-alanine ligase n=1 Tax=Bacillus sp. FJAT-50079 TaxID=2833577 RepID=UPI001BC9BAC7|nr:D-alanine--D-alanine ligase [Bacillus sp. FJAT-50079]MBS4206484.1 D-alanine--D-alanine ligase [Bacillus sp. FJAT-50079]